MHTFCVIRPIEDQWSIVAVSWKPSALIKLDKDIANIIGMSVGEMKTELIQNFKGKLSDLNEVYWNEENDAIVAMEDFFQPRALGTQMSGAKPKRSRTPK